MIGGVSIKLMHQSKFISQKNFPWKRPLNEERRMQEIDEKLFLYVQCVSEGPQHLRRY